MASVVQQLPVLIGVAVGALASYLVTSATERARWQRQQATRWDDVTGQVPGKGV
jgi:xanthine/uracil permease